jgi:hypothetical protein
MTDIEHYHSTTFIILFTEPVLFAFSKDIPTIFYFFRSLDKKEGNLDDFGPKMSSLNENTV